jgi:hypothetical protein
MHIKPSWLSEFFTDFGPSSRLHLINVTQQLEKQAYAAKRLDSCCLRLLVMRGDEMGVLANTADHPSLCETPYQSR